jgi:hypothetical protein
LDECLPRDFRLSFPSHDVHTVQWAGFKGKRNGDLLRSAEAAGYGVMLTVDQGIPHQNNPVERKLSIILIRSQSNMIGDLLPLANAILLALEKIQPGEIITVPSAE